jgi:hypothetical protein
VNQEDIKFVLSLSTERARFAVECNHRAREAYFEQTGEDGISLPDPVAMCIASAGSGNTAPRCLAPPILGALLEIPCPPGDGIGPQPRISGSLDQHLALEVTSKQRISLVTELLPRPAVEQETGCHPPPYPLRS